ncbi:hypothetical protein [Pseudonocardia nigra]|uniref:hypothetical protein n=1 Tax=Pseudonocardia nigra TaxID=1921578 RepID=UPI001C5CC5B1|nr:hypothetical protein [Pseudonocardia nigra]
MTDLPFAPPNRLLNPDELQDLAQRLAENKQLWSDALERTKDHRSYADVFTNEHLGVWAISWMADTHDTGYHDHDPSRGAVHVSQGAIRLGAPPSRAHRLRGRWISI